MTRLIIFFVLVAACGLLAGSTSMPYAALFWGMLIGVVLTAIPAAGWYVLAWVVSRGPVASWIIRRAQRTPYYPITSRDGKDVYMDRWWVFNPYGKPGGVAGETEAPRWPWLPSVRVHHILRADDDGHMHSHPWDARTIVMRNWYREERPATDDARAGEKIDSLRDTKDGLRVIHKRTRGCTGPVRYEMVHRISEVAPGGVYTLWFTWKYRGTWGFLVDGKIVPWREYLGVPKQ